MKSSYYNILIKDIYFWIMVVLDVIAFCLCWYHNCYGKEELTSFYLLVGIGTSIVIFAIIVEYRDRASSIIRK